VLGWVVRNRPVTVVPRTPESLPFERQTCANGSTIEEWR
jgi:hypothetical protein